MASYSFDLSGATIGGGNFTVGSSVSVGSAAGTALKANAPVITTTGGTFTALSTGSVAAFTASGVSGSTYTFTDGNKASVNVAHFTDGADKVSMTGHSLTAYLGAGDDVVSLAGAGASDVVYLGTGADTVVIGKNKGTVADYSYADGDVLQVSAASGVDAVTGLAAQSLAAGNAITVDGATVTAAADADNTFKLKLAANDNKDVVEFWGAVAGKDVVLNGTTYGTNTPVYVDALKSAGASVMGGYGNDTIRLNGSGGNLVGIQKAGGTDTVTSFATVAATSVNGDMANYKGDKLWFNAGTLADITLSGGDASFYDAANNKNTAVLKGVVSKDTGVTKVTFDGTTYKNLMYAGAEGQILTASVKGVDAYLGSGSTTLVGGYKDVSTTINLRDTDSYQHITAVSLQAGTDTQARVIGQASAETTIDAAAYKAGVQVLGGSKADTIALNANDAKQDVVWFGTLAGKTAENQDTVSGFKTGFTTDADVVKLYDTASLAGIKSIASTTAADGTVLTLAGDQQMNLAGTKTSDELLVQFQDQSTASKVAYDNGSGTVTLNSSAADYILGQTNSQGKRNGSAVSLSSTYTDDFVLNLYDTDKYINIADVNAAGADNDNKSTLIVGSKTYGSNVTLKSGAAQQVWGANSDTNSIVAGEKNVVWYGASADGNDYITGANATKATVKLWDVSSFDDIVNTYTFAKNSSGSITAGTSTASLTIQSDKETDTITLLDRAGDTYKAAVGKTDETLSFSTDTQIYAGAKLLNVESNYRGDNVTLFMGHNYGGYYVDDSIGELDGSASQGTFVVVGNTDKGTTFTGGKTSNAFWGGSDNSDTFNANDLATDTFWYGVGDGNDIFNDAKSGQDSVYLWNVSSSDIDTVASVTSVNDTATNAVISFGGVGTLTLLDNASLNNFTFTTSDNVAYKLDTTNKKLVKA